MTDLIINLHFLFGLLLIPGSKLESDDCRLEMNGQLYKSLQLTKTREEYEIIVGGSGSCILRLLAVGGGGWGDWAAGGLGYIQYRSLGVGPGESLVLRAEVGDSDNQRRHDHYRA